MVYFMNEMNQAVKTGRQAAKRAATRARLLAAARDLFLADGYEATTTRAILDQAGSSKGAMYHHFSSKAEMLEDLFRETSLSAIQKAAEQAGTGPHLDRLRRAAMAWLNGLADQDTRRILLELGPEGLGWQRAKEIEDGHSIRALAAILSKAAETGEAPGIAPDVTARLLNALLTEAAFVLAGQGQNTMPEIEARITGFIRSLRA